MKKKNIIIFLIIALTVFGFSGFSYAASANGTLSVTANVTTSCTVGTIGAVSIPSFTGTAVNFNTPLDVTCTSGTPYSIVLDLGLNGLGCYRRANNGAASYLRYNFFTASDLITPWVNNPDCGTNKSGVGTGAIVTHTVYGQIPVQTIPPPGAYNDTITVTVNY